MKYRSSFASRTHDCGELRAVNVGNNVRLCGWLQYQRSDKFLILRDAHGLTQIILDETQVKILQIWNYKNKNSCIKTLSLGT